MDKQDTIAHVLAFKKTFDACKGKYPNVKVGKTLLGIVVDWSDTEVSGLGHAVGKACHKTFLICVAAECIAWARSCQRVKDRIASSPDKSREKLLFAKIALKVTEIKEVENVVTCFKALCGQIKVTLLLEVIPDLNKADAVIYMHKFNAVERRNQDRKDMDHLFPSDPYQHVQIR